MNEYLKKITKLAAEIKRDVCIMEVCGGHTNTVMKYGLRDVLPSSVHLISGPGCPVCVTAQSDIDNMIALAQSGVPIASYGDIMHVPGTSLSLDKAKSLGADIALIYTADEMLKPENKNRVFLAIGFETTTPMTAYLLEHGICIYSTHKIMTPPMRLLTKEAHVDGYIGPGHVSCIVGTQLWKDLHIPLVVSGFGKDQIIRAIYKLLQLIKDGKSDVVNDYAEAVHDDGNKKAQLLIDKHFKICDAEWRGMGTIPQSGLEPIDDKLNAKKKYASLFSGVISKEHPGCRCGEILQGKCSPKDCPLFGKACIPEHPLGACMVSASEGACGIAYKYKQDDI